MNNTLTSLKETALEVALKVLINHEIETFGDIRALVIDTDNKRMQIELSLKGESSPISIDVASYELSEKTGVVHVAFQSVSASREWITAVLNKYVVGQTFPLPKAARLFL